MDQHRLRRVWVLTRSGPTKAALERIAHPRPFQSEPGSEDLGLFDEFAIEVIDRDPPNGCDLGRVGPWRFVAASGVHGTELALRAEIEVSSVVLEGEQVVKVRSYPELLIESSTGGLVRGLAAPRVAATRV